MRRRWIAASLTGISIFLAGCGGGGGDSPAATVNGHDISMTSYNQAVFQRRAQLQNQYGDVCGIKGLEAACKILKQQALQSLIDAEIVREYADAHQITIPQGDLDREWFVIMKKRFAGRLDVLAAYAKKNQTTPADIKLGIADDLLQQEVVYDVTKTMSQYAPAIRLGIIRAGNRKELQNILLILRTGHDFLLTARNLSVSPTSQCAKSQSHCGDLGFVPDAFVPPERQKLLTAPLGSVLGPYISQNELELFLVEARDPHFKMSNTQAYAMRSGVLFAAWLKRQEQAAQISRHVAV